MNIIVDESVFLFLKENRIKLSQDFKKVINHLKENPKMYPKINSNENIRHFVIKNIEFGYFIDEDFIIIADCRFTKSHIKLKVR